MSGRVVYSGRRYRRTSRRFFKILLFMSLNPGSFVRFHRYTKREEPVYGVFDRNYQPRYTLYRKDLYRLTEAGWLQKAPALYAEDSDPVKDDYYYLSDFGRYTLASRSWEGCPITDAERERILQIVDPFYVPLK